MKIAMTESPLFVLRPGFTLNQQPNGKVTVSYPNGDVVSVQPDGAVQPRPPGTADAYELADVTDHGLLYMPLADKGAAFLFPYVTQTQV